MIGLRTVVTGALVEEIAEELQEIAEGLAEEISGEGLPSVTDVPLTPGGAGLGEDVALPGEAPPDTPAGGVEGSVRAEGAAPIADRRREVMDLLVGAGTATEVAVARAAADSYLASDPSDGDVRMARDRLPNPTGD